VSASERARLFVALDLPLDVRAQLTGWSEAELRELPLRLVAPESLHVTLCFLGQRPLVEVDAIRAACQVVAPFPPLALTVGEPRWLPPRRPRVLAIELTEAQPALAELQSALSAALAVAGFYKPESRPFLAHVTTARVPSGQRLRATEVRPPGPTAFTATQVTLYESRLGHGPALYQALTSVKLSG
jgi:2'-5' RNA ligase